MSIGEDFRSTGIAETQPTSKLLSPPERSAAARRPLIRALVYRQGELNVIVNAHSSGSVLTETPVIAAMALRVRDAAAAYRRALDRGAWAVPARVEVMELKGHPWFLGTQAHPEFQSKPNKAHPLFAAFIAAALKKKRKKKP